MGFVVSATPRPLYPRHIDTVPIVQEAWLVDNLGCTFYTDILVVIGIRK
jgi:hypothetical protein